MSDALTDIARDQRRGRIFEDIEGLEKKFIEVKHKSKKKNLARKLIKLWQDYSGVGGGYFGSSNQTIADERIKIYSDILKNKKINENIIKNNYLEQGEFNIGVGLGFIIDIEPIQRYISDKIRKKTGKRGVSLRKYKIKLEVKDVTEYDCEECPYLTKNCLIVNCYSKDNQKLNKRVKK